MARTVPWKDRRGVRLPTMDRAAALAMALLVAAGTCGCTQPIGVPGPTALRQPWMLGIEPMRADPEPQLPFTNRFIADLAAMPRVQVVFVGNDLVSFTFNAWSGGKVLVAPWLHGENNCMNLTYTIFQSGEQQAVFGQVVPPMPAGTEPDSACVDRAAAQFYRTLVMQGL
jgi:hypothetical protein